MPNIYQYIDFRKYLGDFIEEKKKLNPRFSIRLMAGKLGISPGTLVRILSGKRNCSPALLPKITAFIKLRERASEYFSLLVSFDQEKKISEKNRFYEKILTFRNERIRKVEQTQYAIFDKWYYSVVRELIEIHAPVSDCSKLLPLIRPKISLRQIENAIQVLLSGGFITQLEDGCLQPAERFLTTGDRWEHFAIQRFQKAMIDRAAEALVNDPKNERDISSLTIGLKESELQQISDILRKSRQEIIDLAEHTDSPEVVFQINFQAFKLSEKRTKEL